MEAIRRPITETNEFLGRIEAVNRVNVVARVTAFLEQRLFVEGAEVKKGDLLYRLERGPFEADLASKQAQVAQLRGDARERQADDRPGANAAQRAGRPAIDLRRGDRQPAQPRGPGAGRAGAGRCCPRSISTTPRSSAPIDGKIGRTAVTEGNVVGPSSGVLATIVSQDPMYVIFPVPVRKALELRERYGRRAASKPW